MMNKSLLILVFCLISSLGFTQAYNDLFSQENSIRYANHLYNSGEYELSFKEYRRLLFMDSTNVFYQTRILKSAYLGRIYSEGLKQARTFYSSDSLYPYSVAREYAYLLLNTDYTHRTHRLIASNPTFSQEEGTFLFMSNLMLDYQMDSAQSIYDQASLKSEPLEIRNLKTILYQHHEFRPKSRFAAATFSAFLPGSGKLYCGQWKDGLLSLIYTSLTAYQSYRGFNNKGIRSAYGWIFGGLSTGFYLGNIYGSAKAVVRRRLLHEESLIRQTRNVVKASY